MTYLSFVLENRRFLAFGFLMTFFSSFGQTFFISLFGAELRGAFDLGHGEFGTVYMLATLTSAALMIYAGQLIDRLDLREYAAGVGVLISVACLYMAWVPVASVLFLYLAILLLRLSGQGLMSHTSVTAMARYFEAGRGRAIALSSLGFSSGEAVLPLTAVTLVAIVDWRMTWALAGTVMAIGLVPCILWLLKGHGQRHAALQRRNAEPGEAPDPVRHWSRAEVLRDGTFYSLLPAILAPSFILTGIIFHQVHLVDEKGWTMTLFAGGFTFYAAAAVVCAFVTGALADRFTAERLLPFVLVPLGLGLVWLALSDAPVTALGFMMLSGLTVGAYNIVGGAIWAEVYGHRHIGAIRAMTMSLMVVSSALAPAIMGWLIDVSVSMEAIALGCVAWVAAGSLLAATVVGRRRLARA